MEGIFGPQVSVWWSQEKNLKTIDLIVCHFIGEVLEYCRGWVSRLWLGIELTILKENTVFLVIVSRFVVFMSTLSDK